MNQPSENLDLDALAERLLFRALEKVAPHLLKDHGPAADTFLTEVEAAQLLGLSPATLASWRCRRSDGPIFARLGSGKRQAIRYRRSVVLAWAEGRQFTNTACRLGIEDEGEGTDE